MIALSSHSLLPSFPLKISVKAKIFISTEANSCRGAGASVSLGCQEPSSGPVHAVRAGAVAWLESGSPETGLSPLAATLSRCLLSLLPGRERGLALPMTLISEVR